MSTEQTGHNGSAKATRALTIAALGIVFGDIGTSPLYAMRETFESSTHHIDLTKSNILGVLSLILWSLIIVIVVKYLLFVLRADRDGEGGILALTALLGERGKRGRLGAGLVGFGIIGTALLYGDGMITPAISVLSAVEGTEVASQSLSSAVVPISVAILIGIFMVQRHGTGHIGRVFGPVMLVWFSVLGLLGLVRIGIEPTVLQAFWPGHAWTFFSDNHLTGFFALGSIFLVVTGGEALYADLGHFGRAPISRSWFMIVLPGLVLNYLGQGALLIHDPTTIDNPFYRLVPTWGTIPLVILATMATVIASQALISGAFSLTMQAVQLHYLPRMKVIHTSAEEKGQIYVPAVNWTLMVACVGLVIGFRSSSGLAAAYGIAVSITMIITTVLFYFVSQSRLGWSRTRSALVCGPLLIVDFAFFFANVPKIVDGGWFPLVVAAIVFTIMTTWHTGRRLIRENLHQGGTDLETFIIDYCKTNPHRPEGTSVYLFSEPGKAPPAMLNDLKHYGVLPKEVIIINVLIEDHPTVLEARRAEKVDLGEGFTQVSLHYGFRDAIDVPQAIINHEITAEAVAHYMLGHETVVVTDKPGMAMWREHLYNLMYRNSTSAARSFKLPIDRTIESGQQVEL